MHLQRGPDAVAPVDVVVEQLLHLALALGFVDAEHVGAALSGAQRDQQTRVFLALQARQVLLPVGGAPALSQ